jgi:hypothetical protein
MTDKAKKPAKKAGKPAKKQRATLRGNTDPAAVMKAIRADRGLAVKVAKRCGITRMAVYQWPKVPVDRLHDVADATGWRTQDIRPDIFRHRP